MFPFVGFLCSRRTTRFAIFPVEEERDTHYRMYLGRVKRFVTNESVNVILALSLALNLSRLFPVSLTLKKNEAQSPNV